MTLLENVTIECDFIGATVKWETTVDEWEVTLRYEDREWVIPFYMGMGHSGTEPGLKTVLNALFSDASLGRLDFEEFCDTVGLDPYEDEEKAITEHDECKDIDNKLDELFRTDREEIENEVL